MRRITEKVSAIVLITTAFIFVIFTLLLTFRAFEATLLNNHIVVSMIVAISVIFAASAMVLCANLFSDRDVIRNLLLFSDHSSSTRTSMKVVRRIIRSNSSLVLGVRIHKSAVMQEENGFRLRIALGVRSDDVQLTVDKLRVTLEDAFINILGVRFNSIDFKVAKLITNYKLDSQTIKEKASALKDEQVTEQQANYKATKVAKPDGTTDGVILKDDEGIKTTDGNTDKLTDAEEQYIQIQQLKEQQNEEQKQPKRKRKNKDDQQQVNNAPITPEQSSDQDYNNIN